MKNLDISQMTNEKDAIKYAKNIIYNHDNCNSVVMPPIVCMAAISLLGACISLLWHTCPKEQQNLKHVLSLLDEEYIDLDIINDMLSDLGLIFKDFKIKDPDNISVYLYKSFSLLDAKTKNDALFLAKMSIMDYF